MTKKEQGGCMAREIRKWMAALLALTLITGSVQVYGEEQFVDVAEDIQEESRQDTIAVSYTHLTLPTKLEV